MTGTDRIMAGRLGAGLTMMMIGFVLAPSASLAHDMAASCGSEGNDALNTSAYQQVGPTVTHGAHGVQGDVPGFDQRHCKRIASVFAVHGTSINHWIEAGISIGWNCYFTAFRTTAKGFVAATRPDIYPSFECIDLSVSVADGVWVEVKLTDFDQDSVWDVYFDDVWRAWSAQGFVNARVYAGGERENSDDTPQAYWKNLIYVDKSSGVWEDWDDLRRGANGNSTGFPQPPPPPLYYCKKLSNTSMRVSLDPAGACPWGVFST